MKLTQKILYASIVSVVVLTITFFAGAGMSSLLLAFIAGYATWTYIDDTLPAIQGKLNLKPVRNLPQPQPPSSPPQGGSGAITMDKLEQAKPLPNSTSLFGPGKPYVLGYDKSGQPITMDILTSLGVGGVSGMGKTVSMLSLLVQSVIKYRGKVQLFLLDPHRDARSPDTLTARTGPLKPFFLKDIPANPAKSSDEILLGIEYIKAMARDRIDGGEWEDYIIVVADEFTDLLDKDEEVAKAIKDLFMYMNEQTRKVGMFAIVASQQWKSSRLQGTELRNTIGSFLLHNMPAEIARMIVPAEVAGDARALKKGEAILYTNGSATVGTVPLIDGQVAKELVAPYLPGDLNKTVEMKAQPPVQEPLLVDSMKIREYYDAMAVAAVPYEVMVKSIAHLVYGADKTGPAKVDRAIQLMELNKK